MVTGFDDLPALAAPLASEWNACAARRRADSLRMGQLLVEFRRLGVLPDLTPPTVVSFGLRHGLSPAEAREIADVGIALTKIPEIASDVKGGEMSIRTAGWLGRVTKSEAMYRRPPPSPSGAPPAGPPPSARACLELWREAAKTVPAAEFEAMVRRRTEEVRAGPEPVESMLVDMTGTTRRDFGRAKEVASKRAGSALTFGQTLGTVLVHYLDDFDPERVKPGKRRAPDTSMPGEGMPAAAPGRGVPAEVKRQVLARTGGRCAFPGCPHRIWVEFAHRVPHRAGGSREATNLYALCHFHHVRYDRAELAITGPIDAPVFHDARGRRIAPNGRFIEEERSRPAPP